MARAKKQPPTPPPAAKASRTARSGSAAKTGKAHAAKPPVAEDEDLVEAQNEDDIDDVEEVIEALVDGVAPDTEEAEEEDAASETGATAGADEEVDGFVEVAGDDDAPDLDEVLSKEDNVRNLAIRREIERKLEERRLARDLDDLLLDD